MSIQDWDADLTMIEGEIEQLRSAHGQTHLAGNKSLIAHKVSIIQSQLNFERITERIKKLVNHDFPLPPRERTLLHWIQIHQEHQKTYANLHTKVVTRTFWLQLIKTRLSTMDKHSHDAVIDADDLVELTMRQKNLLQTESFLSEAVVALRKKHQQLKTRKEQIGVVVANKQAAHCLQSRLGTSPEAAIKSPLMRALGAYLKTSTAPLRAAAHPSLAEQHRCYADNAEALLNRCRSVVLNQMKEMLPPPLSSRAVSKFQLAMTQLQGLEEDMRDSYAQILNTEPATPRPILVQNAAKEAKTDLAV